MFPNRTAAPRRRVTLAEGTNTGASTGHPGGYLASLKSFSRNARLYLVGSFISNIVQGSFGALLNLYALQLGYGKDFVGILVSVQMFATGFGSLPASFICDRIGRKKSLILAALVVGLGTLGMAWSTASWALILFKAIYGFAFAFLSVTIAPFLMENSTPKERAHLFGVNFASHTFAMMIGNFGSGLIADALIEPYGALLSYRITLTIFAVGVTAATLCYAFIKEQKIAGGPSGKEAIIKGLSEAISLKEARQLIVYNLLIGFGAGMVVPFFNVFLSQKLNATAREVGLVLAVSQIITGLASLAAPILVSKMGKIKSVVTSQLCSIPFLLMIALPPNVSVVSISFFMRNALMNMVNPITSNLSMEIVPEKLRSVISSFTRMANDGARSISAIVAGFLMEHVSLEAPYFVTSVVYLAASFCYYTFFIRYDREEREGKEAGQPVVAGTSPKLFGFLTVRNRRREDPWQT